MEDRQSSPLHLFSKRIGFFNKVLILICAITVVGTANSWAIEQESISALTYRGQCFRYGDTDIPLLGLNLADSSGIQLESIHMSVRDWGADNGIQPEDFDRFSLYEDTDGNGVFDPTVDTLMQTTAAVNSSTPFTLDVDFVLNPPQNIPTSDFGVSSGPDFFIAVDVSGDVSLENGDDFSVFIGIRGLEYSDETGNSSIRESDILRLVDEVNDLTITSQGIIPTPTPVLGVNLAAFQRADDAQVRDKLSRIKITIEGPNAPGSDFNVITGSSSFDPAVDFLPPTNGSTKGGLELWRDSGFSNIGNFDQNTDERIVLAGDVVVTPVAGVPDTWEAEFVLIDGEYLPNNDTTESLTGLYQGDNSNDDYYIVVNLDNRGFNPADTWDSFRIRIAPGDILIEPTAYSSRAGNSSNYLTVIDQFIDLTAQEQGLPVSSDPLDVIGINLATGTDDQIKKVKVHFTGVGSDNDFTSNDLSQLQQSVSSGVALYRDVDDSTYNGAFDDPTNKAIPYPDDLVQLTETPTVTVLDPGEFTVDFTLRDGEGLLPKADIAATDSSVPTFFGIGSGDMSQVITDDNITQTDRWVVKCIVSTKSVIEGVQFAGTGNGTLGDRDTTNIDGPDTWTITFDSANGWWRVAGAIAGGQANAFSGTPYSNQYIQFTINTGTVAWADGDTWTIIVGDHGDGGTFSVISERTGFHSNYDITTGEYVSDNNEARFTISDGDPSDFRVNDTFEFFTVGSEGNGPDYFVVIRGSEFIEFGDDFRVSIGQGNVVLSNDVPVNLNGYTRDISGDIKIESLTDDPVQQIDIPSAPFPIIGINGVSPDNKITSITLTFDDFDQFTVSDLEELSKDLATSGVAIYRDVNIPGEFDSQDEFIPLSRTPEWEITSTGFSYSAMVTLEPEEFLSFPVDDNHSAYRGADYYVVIRTSRQMDSDDEFEFYLDPGDIQINSLPSRSGLLSYEPNRIIGARWPRPTISITDLTVEGQTIDHFTLPPTAIFGINMDSKRTYDQVSAPFNRDEIIEEITVTFRDIGSDGDFTPGDLLPLASQPIGTGHFGVELFLDNDKYLMTQEPGTPGLFDADADEPMPPDAAFDLTYPPYDFEYVTQPTWLSQGNTHTVTIRPRAHVRLRLTNYTDNNVPLGRPYLPIDIDIDKEPVWPGPQNPPYLSITSSSGGVPDNTKGITYDSTLNLWVANWGYTSEVSPFNVVTIEFEYVYRVPYSDAIQPHGDYRGDDFYVTINTDQDLNHGDDFQIELLSGSIQTAVIGVVNGEEAQEFGMYTGPEFRSTSNVITASTETVVFMSPEEERDAIDVESEVTSIVGFNMFDSSQEPDIFGDLLPDGGPEEKFTSLTVHFRDINGDGEFVPSDLLPLNGTANSGLALYSDLDGSDSDGAFDDPDSPNVQVGDLLLPIQNPLWVPEEGGYYVVLNLTGAADIPDYDTTQYDPLNPEIIEYEKKGPDFFLVMQTSDTIRYLDDFFVEISTDNDDIEITNIPTKNSIQKLFVSNMPTFYEDLIAEGKTIGALSNPEEVIGIDLVNESGVPESLASIRVDILNVGDDTAFTPEDLLELTASIGDQEFYNGENAGLAIYADAPSDDPAKNGRFDSGDQLLGPIEIDPQRLPEWGENPGAFSATLKFKDPFEVPTSNLSQNAGNDLFVVIRTSRSISAGDDFTIRIPTESLEFSSGSTVFKSFTTKAITARETSIVTPLLNVITSPGELIGIDSPPKPVIGINMSSQFTTDKFRGMKIDFLEVGSDNDFTTDDLAALTTGVESGVAVYVDSINGTSGIFDATDTLIAPVNPIWVPGETSIRLNFEVPADIPSSDQGLNAGDDFFVVIRTSKTIQLDDDFIVSIPEAAFDLSAAPFNNIVSTDTITAALSYNMTDLSGDRISADSDPREVIGINLLNGGDPTANLSSFRITFNDVTNFELSDLADLAVDDSTGVAVYADSADGISGVFDSTDAMIDINPPMINGDSVIISPVNPLFLPDDDEEGNAGDDYYIVIRTGPRAEDVPGATLNDGDTFSVALEEGALTLSRISVPTSLTTQDISIDSDPPDAPEMFINNNATYTKDEVVSIKFGPVSGEPGGVEFLVSELIDFSDKDPVADWLPLNQNNPLDFTITSFGEGEKTIYAKYRDVARNESAITQGTIILDTIAPNELEFALGDSQNDFTGKLIYKVVLDPDKIDADVEFITLRSGEVLVDGSQSFTGDTVTYAYKTGSSTSLASLTLTDENAAFGSLSAGLLLNPDTSQDQTFVITGNTATTITVLANDGQDLSSVANIGDTYSVCGYEFDLITDALNIFEAWAVDFADNSNREVTGKSTNLEPYALEDSTASFMPNSLIGKEIRPKSSNTQSFTITSNTLTRVQTDTSDGSMTNIAAAGDSYIIDTVASMTIYQDNTFPQIANEAITGKDGIPSKVVEGEVGTVTITATITDDNIRDDLIWADLSVLLGNSSADSVPPDSYDDSVATWSGLSVSQDLEPGESYMVTIYAEDEVGSDHRVSAEIDFGVFSNPSIANSLILADPEIDINVTVNIPSDTFDTPYFVGTFVSSEVIEPESDRFMAVENITKDLPLAAFDINDAMIPAENYGKNVTIEFEFTGEFSETYRVLVMDPETLKYVLAPNQTIATNMITIVDESLGVYAVYDFASASDLNNVIVYPNPFKPEGAVNGTLKFLGVTEDARIRIFDIAGDLLFDGDLVNTGPTAEGFKEYVAEWDGRDDDGNLIGSGVYIYRITDNEGNEKIGKFSVERSY